MKHGGQKVPQNPPDPQSVGQGEPQDRMDIIQKAGGEYHLMSHKGKLLGRHKSKASAKAQEAAINISKARAAGHKIPRPDSPLSDTNPMPRPDGYDNRLGGPPDPVGEGRRMDDHFRLAERLATANAHPGFEGRHTMTGENEAEPEDCLCCTKNYCPCCGGGICGCAGTCDCVDDTGVCDCPTAMHHRPNAVDNPENPQHASLTGKTGGDPKTPPPGPEAEMPKVEIEPQDSSRRGGRAQPADLGLGTGKAVAVVGKRMDAVRRYDVGAALESPEYLDNGWLRADAFLTRTGVFAYRQADGTVRREYRPPEEVFHGDSLKSFAMVPLTNTHPQHGLLDAENTKLYQVGTVESPKRDGEKVRSRILVTDGDAVASAKRGRSFLSCGYTCDLDFDPGEAGGERYDAVQRNIRGNHVALVDEGRAGPEVRLRVDTSDASMLQTGGEGAAAPEDRYMRRIRIDGVDYEMSEQAAQAVERLANMQSEALKKLSARADAAEAALTGARKEIAELPAKIEEKRLHQKEVKKDARKILGEEIDLKGKTPDEMRRMALEKIGLKCDDKDKEYVRAAFDVAVATKSAGTAEGGALFPRADTEAKFERVDGSGKLMPSIAEVEAAAKKRSAEAYKVKQDRSETRA